MRPHVQRLFLRLAPATATARSTQHAQHYIGQALVWQTGRHTQGHESRRYRHAAEAGPLEQVFQQLQQRWEGRMTIASPPERVAVPSCV